LPAGGVEGGLDGVKDRLLPCLCERGLAGERPDEGRARSWRGGVGESAHAVGEFWEQEERVGGQELLKCEGLGAGEKCFEALGGASGEPCGPGLGGFQRFVVGALTGEPVGEQQIETVLKEVPSELVARRGIVHRDDFGEGGRLAEAFAERVRGVRATGRVAGFQGEKHGAGLAFAGKRTHEGHLGRALLLGDEIEDVGGNFLREIEPGEPGQTQRETEGEQRAGDPFLTARLHGGSAEETGELVVGECDAAAGFADENLYALHGGAAKFELGDGLGGASDDEPSELACECGVARDEVEPPGFACARGVDVEGGDERGEVEAQDGEEGGVGGGSLRVAGELACAAVGIAQQDAAGIDCHEAFLGVRVAEAEAAGGVEAHLAEEDDGGFFEGEPAVLGDGGENVALSCEGGEEGTPVGVVLAVDECGARLGGPFVGPRRGSEQGEQREESERLHAVRCR